ncbi:DUF7544 domain-containing protein [Microbacterium suaedae]|uniref:DUF7544 domain-containing protein n=1 Tax=Microbacterium suaedae TaxID=2067813 RepID=UPI0013A6082F|nr:glycerophosphoryl diester phosphodiesterase membrane domain-containing protein [Microbacterium suaedae]
MTDRTFPGWTPAPRQGLVPLYPYGFGTILGKAFAVLKGNPKVLLLFVVGVQTLAMTIYLVAIGGISFAVFSRAETVPETSPEFDQLMWGSGAIVLISSLVLALGLVAVTTIAQGVVVAEVAHASLSEKASLGRLWRRVGPAFWPLVGYSLLIGLMTMLAMAALAAPLVFFALLDTTSGWILFVFGLLIALLGGLVLAAWLGTKLFLAPSTIVLERVGPFRAIRRSWQLTRGRFWPTFGVVALLYVITNVASSIVSGVFSLVTPLITGTLIPLGMGAPTAGAATTLSIVVLVLTSIISFAIAAIMTIVLSAGGALTYIDARMRDEGIDLRMRRYVDAGGNEDDPYTFVPGAGPSPFAAPAPGYGAPTPGYAPPPAASPHTPLPGPVPPTPSPERPASPQPPAPPV